MLKLSSGQVFPQTKENIFFSLFVPPLGLPFFLLAIIDAESSQSSFCSGVHAALSNLTSEFAQSKLR